MATSDALEKRAIEDITVAMFASALDYPLALATAISKIQQLDPNMDGAALLPKLQELFESRGADRQQVAHAIRRIDPSLAPVLMPCFTLETALRPVSEGLAALQNPKSKAFHRDLEQWMSAEPPVSEKELFQLAEDIGEVSPELQKLFIQKLKEGTGPATVPRTVAQRIFP